REVLELTRDVEWRQQVHHRGHVAEVGDAPIAHREIAGRRALTHVHLTRLDTELQAASVELQRTVEAELVDFRLLLLEIDARDLRAERAGPEHEARIAARARDHCGGVGVQLASSDRQRVVELEDLAPCIRGVHALRLAFVIDNFFQTYARYLAG